MWTDDAVYDAECYADELDERLSSRPCCDFCGEHIQEDSFYRIQYRLMELNICERCLEDFRVNV